MGTKVTDAVKGYLFHKDRSKQTDRWYKQKLGAWTAWLAEQGVTTVEEVTTLHVRQFEVYLRSTTNRSGQPVSDYTLHGYIQVVKQFLRWAAIEEELIPEKVALRVKMPKQGYRVIETFSDEQVQALLSLARRSREQWITYRDQAIIAVLHDTGVRVSELTGLRLGDVMLDDSEDPHLLVTGKGRKQRAVPLSKTAGKALLRYLRWRQAPSSESHVFVGYQGEPLTPNGVDQLLKRIAGRLSMPEFWPHQVKAHAFRHTFAINYLAAGGDVYKLSRLLGHSSVVVTEVYLRAFKDRDARRGVVGGLDTIYGAK